MMKWNVPGVAIMTLSLAVCLAAAPAPQAPAMVVTADHADGIYSVGDTVHWTAEWKADEAPPADAHYVIKSGGLKETSSGSLTFEGKLAHFDSTFTEPNTALAAVTWAAASQPARSAVGGAVADPFRIMPAAPEPADFEAFWAEQLAALRKIAPNAQLTPGDSEKPGVTYAKFTLDNIDGTHVQGQIARPEKREKFPAILIPQWAGVYPLQKAWATDRAADGWLAMNIEAHDIPIDNPVQFYNDLYGKGGSLENYWKIGNTDKNTSYYKRMYLSACQSIEYLKTRPDWDGKTIIVMGGSQGGQQSIVVAGLYPELITAALPFVPAACDNWAESIGRHSGFPFWWNQVDNRDANAVHETSKYFDPVYFAKRVKCPVLTACALRDDLAPPSSVLAAYNQIISPKQILILAGASHYDEGGLHQPYFKLAYGTWLPALAKGQSPPVAATK